MYAYLHAFLIYCKHTYTYIYIINDFICVLFNDQKSLTYIYVMNACTNTQITTYMHTFIHYDIYIYLSYLPTCITTYMHSYIHK